MLQHGVLSQDKKQLAASAAYKMINRRVKLNSARDSSKSNEPNFLRETFAP